MPMSNVNTANQDKAEKSWANQWWTDEDKTMNSEHKHIAHTHTHDCTIQDLFTKSYMQYAQEVVKFSKASLLEPPYPWQACARIEV